jgi:hydrogenase maturation protein HypF
MVDNGLADRALIGLAFDGEGYGTDGCNWGGEALIASFTGFERFAHLEYLPLPDNGVALRAPWQIAAGYAHALGIDVDELPFLQNVDKQTLHGLRQQIDNELNPRLTSSMGCLFNAVASLIGVRNDATYEDQPAMEMEVLSKPFISVADPYPCFIEETEHGAMIRLHRLFQSIIEDVRAHQPIGLMGAKFHKTVAMISIDISKRAREATSLTEVALSGSLWQNQLLLDLVLDGLQQNGFTVYFHRHVPTNDGGLSLGQAVIANYVCVGESVLAGEGSQDTL